MNSQINYDNCIARVWTKDGIGAQCPNAKLLNINACQKHSYCEHHENLAKIAGHTKPCHFDETGNKIGIFYGNMLESPPILSPNGRLVINWKIRECQQLIDKYLLEGKTWHCYSYTAKHNKFLKEKAKRNAKAIAEKEKEKTILDREQDIAKKEQELLDREQAIAKKEQELFDKQVNLRIEKYELTKLENLLKRKEFELDKKDKEYQLMFNKLEKKNLDSVNLEDIPIQVIEIKINNIIYLYDPLDNSIYNIDCEPIGKILNKKVYLFSKPENPIEYNNISKLEEFNYLDNKYYRDIETNILYNTEFINIGKFTNDKLFIINQFSKVKRTTIHVTEIEHNGKNYLKNLDTNELYHLDGSHAGYSLAGGQIIALKPLEA